MTIGRRTTNAIVFVATVIIALGAAEIVLRAAPSLMSIAVIDRFYPALRTEISARLGLTTRSDRIVIESGDRFDGGPAIFAYRPDTVYRIPADEADLAVGAIETLPIDGYGFCNPAGKDRRHVADIVSIGGSITFCTAVAPADTYAAHLEALTGLGVYSIDLAGIGPYEYVELLRRYGVGLRPRIVVMNISGGNDLRDIERYRAFRFGDGPEFRKRERLGGPFAVSYALAFLKASFEKLNTDLQQRAAADFRYRVMADGAETAMNVTNGDRDELAYARRLEQGDIGPDLYEEPIRMLVEIAGTEGFAPVVAYVPAAYTAYADSLVIGDPTAAAALRIYDDAQRAWLADNAERLGYLFIDTTGALQAASRSGPLTYFPANLHLTPAGHRAAAEAVAAGLEKIVSTR